MELRGPWTCGLICACKMKRFAKQCVQYSSDRILNKAEVFFRSLLSLQNTK